MKKEMLKYVMLEVGFFSFICILCHSLVLKRHNLSANTLASDPMPVHSVRLHRAMTERVFWKMN